jgi:hypothetical protein
LKFVSLNKTAIVSMKNIRLFGSIIKSTSSKNISFNNQFPKFYSSSICYLNNIDNISNNYNNNYKIDDSIESSLNQTIQDKILDLNCYTK